MMRKSCLHSFKMKAMAMAFVLSFSFACCGAEDSSVLFRADYDTYSVAADFARGAKTSPDMQEGLMMRMFSGPGEKGNALMLASGETVRYEAADNFNPREGSLSFWVCTENWKMSSAKARWFMEIKADGLSLKVGKASRANVIGAWYSWENAPSRDKTGFVCAVMKDGEWMSGVWHRIDVNWNPRGMQLFIDGVSPPVRAVPNLYCNPEYVRGRRWTEIPSALSKGTMTLGGAAKGESVFIDGVVIRSRTIDLHEVQSKFTAYYPLKSGAAIAEPPKPKRTYDETAYKVRAGVDRSVPEPWTPIRRIGKRSFGVLMREYDFDLGPFPSQVRVDGESVLEKSPAVNLKTAGGVSAIVWGKAEVKESGDDKVTLSGQGSGGGVDFTWHGELWFDGAYIIELTAKPRQGEVEIGAMDVSWTVPAAHSKYLLTNRGDGMGNVTVEWKNSYDRALVTYRGETLLWLTGARKGFLWWAESPANFVPPAGGKPVHLSRRANGDVDARVEYIGKSALLKKPAFWRFVFQATPTRTPPKSCRNFHYGERSHMTPHQNATTCGWTTWHKKLDDEDQTHVASLLPRDPSVYGRALDRLHRHNRCKILPYNFPGAVGTTDPEWDTKLDEWRMIPSRIYKKRKGDYVWENRECCGHTGAADLHAYRFEQALNRYATNGYAGVYFDLCDPYTCENELHGCGGTDAFGQPYATCNVLHLREYLMRIYKIAHRNGAVVMNHAHNYFNPICHGFSDYWFPGEQHHRGLEKNPEWFYVEGLSDYELECAWNPAIKGVGMQLLGRHDKTPLVKGHADEEHTIRAMARFLPYDIQISHGKLDPHVVDRLWGIFDEVKLQAATFHGYWDSSVRLTVNDKIRASRYVWKGGDSPYRCMIVASNISREAQKGLCLPSNVPPSAELVELWSGKTLSAADVGLVEIPAGHFVLLGIR